MATNDPINASLLRNFGGDDKEAKAKAIKKLCELKHYEIIPDLLAIVFDFEEPFALRASAVRGLSELGQSDSLEKILMVLDDGYLVRWAVVQAVAKHKLTSAVNQLLNILKEDVEDEADYDLHVAVINALDSIGTQEAIFGLIRELFRNDNSLGGVIREKLDKVNMTQAAAAVLKWDKDQNRFIPPEPGDIPF